MILKPYSEKLKRYFETEEDCLKAEQIYDEKEEEKKKFREEKREDAKKLEELKNSMLSAYKEANAQYDAYNEALKEFCKKYQEPFRTVEYSISPVTSPAHLLNSLISTFFEL